MGSSEHGRRGQEVRGLPEGHDGGIQRPWQQGEVDDDVANVNDDSHTFSFLVRLESATSKVLCACGKLETGPL